MKRLLIVAVTLCFVAGCDIIPPIPQRRVDYDALMTGRDRKLMQERNDRFPMHGGFRVDTDHSGSISSQERSSYEERLRREQKRKRPSWGTNSPR